METSVQTPTRSVRTALPVTIPLPHAPAALGISRRSIYRAAEKGQITLLKMGRTTLVVTDSALAFIDNLPRAELKSAQ